MKRITLLILLVLALPQSKANAQTNEELRLKRLGALARVWGHVKYFHPFLPHLTNVNWDSVLIAAIPAVRSAQDAASYHAAVESMLRPLNDPLTSVMNSRDTKPRSAAVFSFNMDNRGVLRIATGEYVALAAPDVQNQLRQAATALTTAQAVVLDLRTSTRADGYGLSMLIGSLNPLERLLTTDTLVLPGEMRRVYYGYESASPFSSGQYRTGRFIREATRLVPAEGARRRPLAILINENSALTPGLLALQHAGVAKVLIDAPFDYHSVGGSTTLNLADGLNARVRTSSYVFGDSRSTMFQPDEFFSGDNSEFEIIDGSHNYHARRIAATRAPTPVIATLRSERSYATMTNPSSEYRLLSLFRLWNVVEYFYPYKDLLDKDWQSVLEEFIPIFEQAEGERAYNIAVARLVTRMQDSHAYLSGSGPAKYLVASGYPGVRIRMIENTLLVTAVTDTLARKAGITVGDVLLRVDDEPARNRYERAAALVSASTPQDRANKATQTFLTGAPGSKLQLTVRDRANRERTVELIRKHEDYTTLYHRERTGDIIRILPGNIGYIDLDRLSYDMLDSAFARVKNTRAIIFDMRGYPKGLFWAIAPRLTRTPKCAAMLHTPMPGHQSPAPATETLCQMIYAGEASQHYAKPTVMLIDERSVSQAEHTGLYLKAANGTRFVGTRTAGANGELATMVLPGGITVGFTGQAVTWPDGRQLQRVGLKPDVLVVPTVAGIRAGRDEILDAAVRLVR